MNSWKYAVLSMLVAGCGGSSAATSSAASASAPPAGAFSASGSFFALSVADADAGTRWYSEKLGMHVVMRPAKTNGTTAVVLEGSGLVVELLQSDSGLPLSRIAPSVIDPMRVHGIVKAGLIVADLDDAIATLRARNVPIAFGPYPATAEQRANAIIRDNEGNLIQLLGK